MPTESSSANGSANHDLGWLSFVEGAGPAALVAWLSFDHAFSTSSPNASATAFWMSGGNLSCCAAMPCASTTGSSPDHLLVVHLGCSVGGGRRRVRPTMQGTILALTMRVVRHGVLPVRLR